MAIKNIYVAAGICADYYPNLFKEEYRGRLGCGSGNRCDEAVIDGIYEELERFRMREMLTKKRGG